MQVRPIVTHCICVEAILYPAHINSRGLVTAANSGLLLVIPL